MAIQLGAFLILAGLGFAFIPGLTGLAGPLIAAGTALAVLGGILTAVTADEKPGVSAGGGAGASSAGGATLESPTGEFASGVEPIESEPRTVVNFTVQGDIFDSENTGKRVADLLNASFESDNVTLNQVTA